jgi:hypothetical protein
MYGGNFQNPGGLIMDSVRDIIYNELYITAEFETMKKLGFKKKTDLESIKAYSLERMAYLLEEILREKF